MPFKSQAQRKFLFARKPAVAKKFSVDAPKQPAMEQPPKPPSFSALDGYLNQRKIKPPKGF